MTNQDDEDDVCHNAENDDDRISDQKRVKCKIGKAAVRL